MIKTRSLSDILVCVVIYTILGSIALSCVLPFVHVLAQSLSKKQPIIAGQVGLWPVGFNLQNYQYIIRDKGFMGSTIISVERVLAGVLVGLFVCSLTAYPLSRDRVDMPGRLLIKGFMLFCMLFSGGLIPNYLAIRSLGLVDNFLVLILPGALNVYYAILIMNFFRGLPHELEDAALIDGASHWDVLFRVFIPISKPVIATVALFMAVAHWNSWFDGFLYLSRREMWPLQSYLYALIGTRQAQWTLGGGDRFLLEVTPEGVQAAMILFASFPILMVYPFLQRYFVTGLTIGAVKE